MLGFNSATARWQLNKFTKSNSSHLPRFHFNLVLYIYWFYIHLACIALRSFFKEEVNPILLQGFWWGDEGLSRLMPFVEQYLVYISSLLHYLNGDRCQLVLVGESGASNHPSAFNMLDWISSIYNPSGCWTIQAACGTQMGPKAIWPQPPFGFSVSTQPTIDTGCSHHTFIRLKLTFSFDLEIWPLTCFFAYCRRSLIRMEAQELSDSPFPPSHALLSIMR